MMIQRELDRLYNHTIRCVVRSMTQQLVQQIPLYKTYVTPGCSNLWRRIITFMNDSI